MYLRACLSALVLLGVVFTPPAASALVLPGSLHLAGARQYSSPPTNCMSPEVRDQFQLLHQASVFSAPSPSGNEQTLFPLYAWPFQNALNNGLILVNYVDDDNVGGTIHDYNGNTWAYDGHTGTDIVLTSFRAMDRGFKVVAASPGTVSNSRNDQFDRNTDCSNPDPNYVEVDNGDGTFTNYLHLRKNSVVVKVGETVAAGQFLGLVGSSGCSSDPHLHFEPTSYPAGVYTPRDPWHGTYNPQASLWQSQLPYAGAAPLRVFDMEVSTLNAIGGDINNISFDLFRERLTQPVVLGAGEPYLPLVLLVQGKQGDTLRIEIRRPDNSLFDGFDFVLGEANQRSFFYFYWNFSPSVTPAMYGTWKVSAFSGSTLAYQTPFTVGASTVFGPRFYPLDGRSILINGSVQRDTMHVSSLDPAVTYSLLGAPTFISLHDSTVTFPATSPQPSRSMFFQVLAKDAGGRADTMWYHVVDLSKPRDSQVGVAPSPSLGRFSELRQNQPNPFGSRTSIHFSVRRSAAVKLVIYDLAGRRVRKLLDRVLPGDTQGREVVWDGRSDSGARLASGVYLCRLSTGSEVQTRRMVLLN